MFTDLVGGPGLTQSETRGPQHHDKRGTALLLDLLIVLLDFPPRPAPGRTGLLRFWKRVNASKPAHLKKPVTVLSLAQHAALHNRTV